MRAGQRSRGLLTEDHLASIVRSLPAFSPFIAPETLERARGEPFRLRLGANESAWGCSPKVRAAAQEVMADVSLYCDPEGYELRSLIGQEARCRVANVALGEGIDGLLGLMVRAFVDPGEAVVTTDGSYPTFLYHCRGYGAAVTQVPYRNERPDLEALLSSARRQRAKLIYLANPDNPSGALSRREDVESLIASLPERCVLVLDEAYADFVPTEELPDIDPEGSSVIRLRTFSKAHGLAGLRVGFALAPMQVIGALDRIRAHFGVNLVGQRLCAASMKDPTFLSAVVAEVKQGRSEYQALGRTLELRPLPSATNFVTFDAGSAQASIFWVNALAAAGVFIRRPAAGALACCMRITVGTAGQRAVLSQIMRNVASGVTAKAQAVTVATVS